MKRYKLTNKTLKSFFLCKLTLYKTLGVLKVLKLNFISNTFIPLKKKYSYVFVYGDLHYFGIYLRNHERERENARKKNVNPKGLPVAEIHPRGIQHRKKKSIPYNCFYLFKCFVK